jgi:hypothetical protein
VELGAFNGLHLAARSHADRPTMPVFVTYPKPDLVFERVAAQVGARFLVDPAENPSLVATVQTALKGVPEIDATTRLWPRKRLAGSILAEANLATASIVDISYGGLKLSFDGRRQLPDAFEVHVPTADVHVRVHPVWTIGSDDGFWCGAEIAGNPGESWRSFVDSVA